MAVAETAARSGRWKYRITAAVVLVLLLLLLLLLLRTCNGPPIAGFNYFRVKAGELGNDPARVVAFVRDDVRLLAHRGDAKGPLGALWDGAASPEEKVALANAILSHCAGAPKTTLDAVAPARDKSRDAAAPGLALRIVHVALGESGPKETVVCDSPSGAFVGDVHSIEVPEPGRTRFTIRGPAAVVRELEAGPAGEEVRFELSRPGDAAPRRVTRELWRRDNRVGPVAAVPGDRHDFVIWPCRITKYVREKEEQILAEAGRREAPEARPYLGLLEYGLLADAALADLEKTLGVRATFEAPRILVMSRFAVPELPGSMPVEALDLRLNRTAFEGNPADARMAASIRSFVEAGLEHEFLLKWAGRSAASVREIFARVRDDFPDSCARRVALAHRTLSLFASTAGADGRAVFRARAPGKAGAVLAEVEATPAAEGGLRLKSGKVRGDIAAKLRDAGGPDLDLSGARPLSPEDAAVAVEVALMAADVTPGIPPDFVLEVSVNRGAEPLVAPGAGFVFRWGEGDARTDQSIRVEECAGDLAYRWKVRTGVRPALGLRRIAAAAVASAERHNPWYVAGESSSAEATSFCVSRRVHAALKAGKASPFAVYGPAADAPTPPPPAPGTLEPEPPMTHRVKINGREEEISVLRARCGDASIGILDDARWPVGMADALTEVETSVRGRVVDPEGLGISGVTVAVEGRPESATTWPDGTFRLPPAPGGYGKVRLLVAAGTQLLGNVAADLTAPGREEIQVRVPRPRIELIWISPKTRDRLRDLPISGQAKRHANRDLDDGLLILIPNRMIDDPPGLTIAYYAHDAATGDVLAVTEDGLHGATDAPPPDRSKRVRDEIVDALIESKGDFAGAAAIHMYRGALVAHWVYASHRVGTLSHEEAVERLWAEMDEWEARTNILAPIEKIPANEKAGEKLREKIADLLNAGMPNVDGDGAKSSFKLGYIGATLYLSGALTEKKK
ncbi:MAG: carboxypeptidase regulatory-like domain-containing protein [Planctomycetes bacterium]|nr:carboxypeptidase regulatory-like domain-containing protein [Planctomycetota bacterium]